MPDDTKPVVPRWPDCEHGDQCDCLLLAKAVGAGRDAVDVNYCRQVLQRHWRMKCNHGAGAPNPKQTPELPARDAEDPVQALLAANSLGSR